MVENTTQEAAEPTAPMIGSRPTPKAVCPMAMCKGMMESPPSGFLLMVPATVLLLVGVLIFVEPVILVWLMGTAFVLFGVMLFMMANFIRRLSVSHKTSRTNRQKIAGT